MTRVQCYVIYAVLAALLLAAFVFSPDTAEAGVQWCRHCGG